MSSLVFPSLLAFVPLAARPEDDAPGAALWITLAVIAIVIGWAVRYALKASERRLDPKALAEAKRLAELKKQDDERQAAADEARAATEAKRQEQEKVDKKADKKGDKKPDAAPKGPPKPELLLPSDRPIADGLLKTREEGFIARLGKLFQGKQIDAALLDQVEEVLFTADIGVRTASKLLDELRARASRKELADADAIWRYLEQEAITILDGAPDPRSFQRRGDGPHVVLIIGVNGAGKTTSIGKLAHRMVARGDKVLLGAGDTFRAAAADQLDIWARRVGADIVDGKDGSDPSAVLYEATTKGQQGGYDTVILDTAGRLHTNVGLVKELEKVKRVVQKAMPEAPHEIILVLDGTNGQNAIAQAKVFGDALGVTSIALTKLDGTAKGGVILGIVDELKIPISWIGIGERMEDLRPFDKREFVDALFRRKGG
ncbi:MAG: signal recognition particle-docking protein FtsY [Myxococcales bacterium]|nr:signal recognition particle-docking protein FtsY [Myxococcales bacterium]